MVERLEQHIEKINNLDLEVSEKAMKNLSNILGKDLWEPASEVEINRSQDWLKSPTKHSIDKVFALIIAKSGGEYFVKWAKNRVEKQDGNDGFHHWQVGFFSVPESIVQSSTKIRTMIPNAASNLTSPFDEKSFGRVGNDNRILNGPLVRFMRRSGLDSLNEVVFGIKNGDWHLVGTRPYNLLELQGIRILWKLRDEPELGLDNNVKKILEDYPIKVKAYKPRPAICGPLAAFQDEVGHMTRMTGDIAYWENASPMGDFRLFTQSILNRVVRGVGVK
jgi:lipopolysaccharide/colanic/teichoic acid biosynthesis glycosyltransferase